MTVGVIYYVLGVNRFCGGGRKVPLRGGEKKERKKREKKRKEKKRKKKRRKRIKQKRKKETLKLPNLVCHFAIAFLSLEEFAPVVLPDCDSGDPPLEKRKHHLFLILFLVKPNRKEVKEERGNKEMSSMRGVGLCACWGIYFCLVADMCFVRRGSGIRRLCMARCLIKTDFGRAWALYMVCSQRCQRISKGGCDRESKPT